MPRSPPGRAGDMAELASALKVLSSEIRLDLLRQLRQPRAAADLVGRPQRGPGDLNPGRAMSGEGVRQHLVKLRGAGLVREAPGPGPQRHVIDRPRMYALAQSVLRLATLSHEGEWGDPDETVPAAPGAAPRGGPAGPRLVLVMGVYEGRAYPLSPASAAEGRGATWGIGRKPGLAVSLDYDPYVSRQHASITREGDAFLLHDAPRSQNGTWVNWRAIPKEAPFALSTGDIVGVGRSLLVFRAA